MAVGAGHGRHSSGSRRLLSASVCATPLTGSWLIADTVLSYSIPKRHVSPNVPQRIALHEAARRLVVLTMAGDHLGTGDGFVPVHALEEVAAVARLAFSPAELADIAQDAAEVNGADGPFEPPNDLAVRVLEGSRGRFRWMLLRALGDGSWSEHAAGDEAHLTYADAFTAGAAVLAAEGRARGQQAWRPAANDPRMLPRLSPNAA